MAKKSKNNKACTLKNKKNWLVIKGVLIAVIVVSTTISPPQSNMNRWVRFVFITTLIFTLVLDITDYKKENE
jgi:uncharacterized membrane protein YdcZ (DUF606 family)